MFFRLLLVVWLLSVVSAYAVESPAVFPVSDKELLGQAIEDSNFGDFSVAKSKLEILHKRYPKRKAIIENLANVYVLMNRMSDALDIYNQWLKLAKNKYVKEARFAWIGKATLLSRLKKDAEAREVLQNWLKHYPKDVDAIGIYSSLLVDSGQDNEADMLLDKLLNQKDISNSEKASVYYFKSLNAYKRGDVSNQKTYAAESVRLDANGEYVALAKDLLEAVPERRLGWHADLSTQEFYTSNVDLLPDFKSSTTGQSKSDMVTQVDAQLGYNLGLTPDF